MKNQNFERLTQTMRWKSLSTLPMWVFPFFLPRELLLELTTPLPAQICSLDRIYFLRFVGLFYSAVYTVYLSGFIQAVNGISPRLAVAVGLLSNGFGTFLVPFGLLVGWWSGLPFITLIYLLLSFVITLLITLNLWPYRSLVRRP